jgi:hypothetical protein
MTAKEFLKTKGIHGLDTKKRFNETITWMEEYAALRQPPVIKSVCPNPECKSENITHEEKYSYCEDCRRMFNGQTVL